MGLVNTAELKQMARRIRQLEAENRALRELYDGMTRYMSDSNMLWQDMRNIYERVSLELEKSHDEHS